MELILQQFKLEQTPSAFLQAYSASGDLFGP
jgi:hypothetical protein